MGGVRGAFPVCMAARESLNASILRSYLGSVLNPSHRSRFKAKLRRGRLATLRGAIEMKSFNKRANDWLLAVSDWLWAMLGIVPKDLFELVTFKRIILAAGLLVLVVGFAQVFTVDVAIGFAADTLVYFDIASAVILVVALRRVRPVTQAAARIVRAAQKVPVILLRFWARQRRNAL
jgi:hypothetical protein